MNHQPFTRSIRFSLALSVVLMGALGLALALLTSERYKQVVLENEQQSLTELLSHEVSNKLDEQRELQLQLAQTLQKTTPFRDAAQRGDRTVLNAILNQQFHQYLVTSDQLQLKQLSVYNTDFSALAQSIGGSQHDQDGTLTCRNVVSAAARRQGIERLKTVTALCADPARALQASIIPVGGFRPFAYLMVVSSPAAPLLGISLVLDSPLEVVAQNGRLIAHTEDGGRKDRKHNWAIATFNAQTADGTPAFSVRVYKDASLMLKRLSRTRATLLLSAAALTGLMMLLTFLVLRRTLLHPLAQLSEQVQRITHNRSHLGEPLAISGSSEIEQLAHNFDAMSTQLAQLYRELELMAFSDPLTQLPNRAWFHDSLQRQASLTQRGAPGFALLFIDLDRFKEINDSLGHQTGDEALKLISARILGVLRGGDYLARLGSESSDSLARMGGDEFAVLLPAIQNHDAAERVAQKIVAAVARPLQLEGRNLQLGASIGIALYPDDAPDTRTLVHRADLAMYQAKTKGGGYTSYNPALELSEPDPDVQ